MFSRKRPCVLCGKIPLLPDDGENSAPQAFRQKKHGRGASAAIRAGKAVAQQGCEAQRPKAPRLSCVPESNSARHAQNTAGLCDGAGDRLRPAGKKTEAWREVSPNSAGVWRFACSGRLLMRRKSAPEGRILPCLCSAPKAFPASEKHVGKERPRKNSLTVARAGATARPSLSETFTSPPEYVAWEKRNRRKKVLARLWSRKRSTGEDSERRIAAPARDRNPLLRKASPCFPPQALQGTKAAARHSRRRSARKNTGGELRPLSVPGRRSHRGDAQAQRPPPASFLRA